MNGKLLAFEHTKQLLSELLRCTCIEIISLSLSLIVMLIECRTMPRC